MANALQTSVPSFTFFPDPNVRKSASDIENCKCHPQDATGWGDSACSKGKCPRIVAGFVLLPEVHIFLSDGFHLGIVYIPPEGDDNAPPPNQSKAFTAAATRLLNLAMNIPPSDVQNSPFHFKNGPNWEALPFPNTADSNVGHQDLGHYGKTYAPDIASTVRYYYQPVPLDMSTVRDLAPFGSLASQKVVPPWMNPLTIYALATAADKSTFVLWAHLRGNNNSTSSIAMPLRIYSLSTTSFTRFSRARLVNWIVTPRRLHYGFPGIGLTAVAGASLGPVFNIFQLAVKALPFTTDSLVDDAHKLYGFCANGLIVVIHNAIVALIGAGTERAENGTEAGGDVGDLPFLEWPAPAAARQAGSEVLTFLLSIGARDVLALAEMAAIVYTVVNFIMGMFGLVGKIDTAPAGGWLANSRFDQLFELYALGIAIVACLVSAASDFHGAAEVFRMAMVVKALCQCVAWLITKVDSGNAGNQAARTLLTGPPPSQILP